ncbi:FluG domain-containing protein [Botrytis cinerea]
MAPTNPKPINSRIVQKSTQIIHNLHTRIEHRRPKSKNKLSSEYYQNLIVQHNNPNTAIEYQYADTTTDNIQSIRSKFMRFCHEKLQQDWKFTIRDCSLGTTLAFLHYIHTEDRYIDTFGLDNTVKSKPVIGVDDLLLLLNHHWARDTSVFPTERHRIQFALILLILFGTGCRPAELVDAQKKPKSASSAEDISEGDESDDDYGMKFGNSSFGKDNNNNKTERCDALCYEDIRLLADTKDAQKPTVFFFTEIDDPIFCPITHLIALALADNAFEAPSLSTPELVFEHKIHGPIFCTPLNWKAEKLKTPIFRRYKATSPDSLPTPLPYSQFRDCLNRLGCATGFQEKLTSYCFRRGTANIVDQKATEAVRDQVMRHKAMSGVYNGAYINERIRFDVHLMRDPRAPVVVPNDILAALPPDPHITALERERQNLKGPSYRIQGTDIEAEVRRLTNEIGSARSRRRKIISEEYRADYFRRRPTEDIERQNNGYEAEEYVEPIVEYQIPERRELAELLCTRFGSTKPQDAVKLRIQAADLMLALCGCREIPQRYMRRAELPAQPIIEKDLSETDPFFPLVCGKSQCPFCIGDETRSYEQRIGSFCRPAKMMEHVERVHLKGQDPGARMKCYHPIFLKTAATKYKPRALSPDVLRLKVKIMSEHLIFNAPPPSLAARAVRLSIS